MMQKLKKNKKNKHDGYIFPLNIQLRKRQAVVQNTSSFVKILQKNKW